MSLPTVTIGPHRISRLTIGGNPFSGFSHQNAQRDAEMLDYYSVARIKPTDAVNVGMFTKDNPRMVQENVELARRAMGA
jgi:hypothetical protein